MPRNTGLGARYDTAALRPPVPLAMPSPADAAGLQTLRAWCLAGAVPRMTRPWAMAFVEGDNAVASRQVAQLCLERDGSWQMAACKTAFGRIALRLKTKAHDLMVWRQRQASDAWDSGYAIDTPSGLRALMDFEPRRPTLVVATGVSAATLHTMASSLSARQSGFAHPVRLLVVGAEPRAQQALAAETLHCGNTGA